MSNDKERLATAQWVLERNLGWIAAAEIKVGIIIALDTAMLAGLAAVFGAALVKTTWSLLCASVAACTLIIGLFCAAKSVMPCVTGPNASLLFFGRIAELDVADYTEKFRDATEADLLRDWTEQIYRNAQIACQKHSWVIKAMGWSFFSALPWSVAIALLVEP